LVLRSSVSRFLLPQARSTIIGISPVLRDILYLLSREKRRGDRVWRHGVGWVVFLFPAVVRLYVYRGVYRIFLILEGEFRGEVTKRGSGKCQNSVIPNLWTSEVTGYS
jgi:hypothetical protein